MKQKITAPLFFLGVSFWNPLYIFFFQFIFVKKEKESSLDLCSRIRNYVDIFNNIQSWFLLFVRWFYVKEKQRKEIKIINMTNRTKKTNKSTTDYQSCSKLMLANPGFFLHSQYLPVNSQISSPLGSVFDLKNENWIRLLQKWKQKRS